MFISVVMKIYRQTIVKMWGVIRHIVMLGKHIVQIVGFILASVAAVAVMATQGGRINDIKNCGTSIAPNGNLTSAIDYIYQAVAEVQ